jgi:serine/threonine-protein kinase HipA
MRRCPITYEEITLGMYSGHGLRMLSPKLLNLAAFPYTAEEQRLEAARRATKMSIQGVQPKLSTRLNVVSQQFEVVDANGQYIMKPQSDIYPNLPQNEDLTMRMASLAGIETPLHGMTWCRDGSLTYFIKRFDRIAHNKKLALEDFAQLEGKSRETKYDSSMERVAETVRQFCTFPAVEYVKLFRLTLFNYLVGNEDMHLKNFSLIRRDGMVELSPAYDLLNTTIAIGKATEEIALPLHGKKRNLTSHDLVQYYGGERLALQPKVIDQVLRTLADAKDKWLAMIQMSFLSERMKEEYVGLLTARFTSLCP